MKCTVGDAGVPRIRRAEAASLAVAQDLPGQRVLCTSIGRGQAARQLAQSHGGSQVVLWYLDQFQQHLALSERPPGSSSNSLSIVCQADLPDESFDLAVLPCTLRGEAELHRELLQQAYQRLEPGGYLITSVDNPKDRWLHEQVKVFGTKVSVRHAEGAITYLLRKTKPLKRARDFQCEFCYRHRGQSVIAVTRPGVFSHRRLDAGAKTLMEAVAIQPGQRLIDIGCGCGAVALAIAKVNPAIQAYAIDSNARAIQCTEQGILRNELGSVTAALTCQGVCDAAGTYDVAVCNPPYFANFQIAALFLRAAKLALKRGGKLYVVTKFPAWYQDNLSDDWLNMEVSQTHGYAIVQATAG